jgi:hypothetical protein
MKKSSSIMLVFIYSLQFYCNSARVLASAVGSEQDGFVVSLCAVLFSPRGAWSVECLNVCCEREE